VAACVGLERKVPRCRQRRFAGSINYLNAIGRLGAAINADPGLADALATGYAASSTDTGHKGGFIDAKWALGHQEEIVDFGYRAVHETAERSKAIIRAFYGEAPVIAARRLSGRRIRCRPNRQKKHSGIFKSGRLFKQRGVPWPKKSGRSAKTNP
jgi:Tannase and feruloyl esterase